MILTNSLYIFCFRWVIFDIPNPIIQKANSILRMYHLYHILVVTLSQKIPVSFSRIQTHEHIIFERESTRKFFHISYTCKASYGHRNEFITSLNFEKIFLPIFFRTKKKCTKKTISNIKIRVTSKENKSTNIRVIYGQRVRSAQLHRYTVALPWCCRHWKYVFITKGGLRKQRRSKGERGMKAYTRQ